MRNSTTGRAVGASGALPMRLHHFRYVALSVMLMIQSREGPTGRSDPLGDLQLVYLFRCIPSLFEIDVLNILALQVVLAIRKGLDLL